MSHPTNNPAATSAQPHDDLERFVRAQERDYATALGELRAGQKRTHWIWYVLPQLRGLGRSPMAREYGITNRQEAMAYATHPVLGPRLVECVEALLQHAGQRSAVEMLGETDAMKLRSCVSLFAAVVPQEACFAEALRVFFGDVPDRETLRLLDEVD